MRSWRGAPRPARGIRDPQIVEAARPCRLFAVKRRPAPHGFVAAFRVCRFEERGDGRRLPSLALSARRYAVQRHPNVLASPAGRGQDQRCDVAGRGFNLFRGLLRNLRAIVACRATERPSPSPGLTQGSRGEGQPPDQVRGEGPGERQQRPIAQAPHPNPLPLKRGEGVPSGRGFNLFRGLLRNLRAIVVCRGGGASRPSPGVDSGDHREKVSSRIKSRGGARRAPTAANGRALTPTLSPLKRGEGVPSGCGFNLFRGLLRNLRAIVVCRGGGASLSLPGVDSGSQGEGQLSDQVPGRGPASPNSGQSPAPLTLSPLKRARGPPPGPDLTFSRLCGGISGQSVSSASIGTRPLRSLRARTRGPALAPHMPRPKLRQPSQTRARI